MKGGGGGRNAITGLTNSVVGEEGEVDSSEALEKCKWGKGGGNTCRIGARRWR